jgi:hypothetical protein
MPTESAVSEQVDDDHGKAKVSLGSVETQLALVIQGLTSRLSKFTSWHSRGCESGQASATA